MKQVVIIIKFGAALIFGLLFLGFGIGVSKGAPEYAIVYVDPNARIYFAPPCVTDRQGELLQTTIGEARKAGLESDQECRDTGAFSQDVRSLSGKLLENFGILGPLKPRWSNDGSWNW